MSKIAVRAPLVRASVVAIIGGAALVGFSAQLGAAEAQEADEDEVELEEVQVTGTRIQQRGNNYTAANPINSVTGDDLRRLGIVNVADALTQLVPQNLSSYQQSMTGSEMTGNGAFFIGQTIANLRGLDPQFGSRTLTLVDGRRMVSVSNQADVVDMNIIPSNLLQRMDVVTGGASAAYGSGAMAGVVNLVLNRRMQGFNVDMDYGVHEEGDGGNPHVSLGAGTSLFGGRGHITLGAEWQKQSAIRDCAAARDWCAESRTLFNNTDQFFLGNNSPFIPRDGFEGYPGRFQMSGQRYGQFHSEGVILQTSASAMSGYMFTPDGTNVVEYPFGFGSPWNGFGTNSTINGDGPLTTTGVTMTASSDRKTLFGNFEYDVTDRATAYLQANYYRNDALNRNTYTQGSACVRFNSRGRAGGSVAAGTSMTYNFASPAAIWSVPSFIAFLGLTPGGIPNFYAGTLANPPAIQNATNVVWGDWGAFGAQFDGNVYIISLTLTDSFTEPSVLPGIGDGQGTDGNGNPDDAYAFLYQLSPDALQQMRAAFGNNNGSGPGPGYLFNQPHPAGMNGPTDPGVPDGDGPCTGYTAMYKVWNPQIHQFTDQTNDQLRGVLGVRGRFGSDWNYDAYFSYGANDSASVQNNAWTNIRLAFALDAVLDADGNPVCRVVRDGVPTTAVDGSPLQDTTGLQALAADCVPLNIFGSTFTGADAARQQQALDYAFQSNRSGGTNSLMNLAFNTSGTLWRGWGAGPLRGAFTAEFRRDKTNNAALDAPLWERTDFSIPFPDGFGGTTEAYEGSVEVNMPLVSGVEGVALFDVGGAVRYAKYRNKGGAGTTGQSLTQDITNWKFSTTFSPFDWVRLRGTVSRDLRAAGYRDLFLNQPSGSADSADGSNPWLPWVVVGGSQDTTVQNDRWYTVQAGNINLKPETSDTLTLGLVLRPGGWAQGMNISADYYDIKVKDGIAAPIGQNTVQACWLGSGNEDPRQEVAGPGGVPITIINPNAPTTLFDPNFSACQDIVFGLNPDGSVNTGNILSYVASKPINNAPFRRRGIDMSWDYTFALNRVFENMPGTIFTRMATTKALESSGLCDPNSFGALFGACVGGSYIDTVGQMSTPTFGYPPGLQATPEWSGNMSVSYLMGAFSVSLRANYVGSARINNQFCDDPTADCWWARNAQGQFVNANNQVVTDLADRVPAYGTIDDNSVESYVNFGLSAQYDLPVSTTKQFQVWGTVNNLFDRDPPYSGGYVSGASPQFHDIYGRSYRMGVRVKF